MEGGVRKGEERGDKEGMKRWVRKRGRGGKERGKGGKERGKMREEDWGKEGGRKRGGGGRKKREKYL